jgi:hypothetical protein
MKKYLENSKLGFVLNIRLIPNAKNNSMEGIYNKQLKIKIAAPPVDNKANKVLIKFLSQYFNFPQKSIKIITGLKSKNKKVLFEEIKNENFFDQCL